jgi:hypothetical protein
MLRPGVRPRTCCLDTVTGGHGRSREVTGGHGARGPCTGTVSCSLVTSCWTNPVQDQCGVMSSRPVQAGRCRPLGPSSIRYGPTPGAPKSSALHDLLAIDGTPLAGAPLPRAGNDLVRVTEDDSPCRVVTNVTHESGITVCPILAGQTTTDVVAHRPATGGGATSRSIRSTSPAPTASSSLSSETVWGPCPRTVHYRQLVSAAGLRPTAIRTTITVYAQSRATPAHPGSGKYPADGA